MECEASDGRARLVADLAARPAEAAALVAKRLAAASPQALGAALAALAGVGLLDDEDPPIPSSPVVTAQWKKSRPGAPRESSQPMLGRKSRSSMTLEPLPPSPPAVSLPSLEQRLQSLLSEPPSSPEVVKFVQYLESVYAVENFEFLKDVAAFTAEFSSASVKVRDRKARKIYDTYFAPDAPMLVNMSSRAAAPVVSRFGPLSVAVFAPAVAAVRQNLQEDILVRYLEKLSADEGGANRRKSGGEEIVEGLRQAKAGLGTPPLSPDALSPPPSPPAQVVDYDRLKVTHNPLLGFLSRRSEGGNGSAAAAGNGNSNNN